MSSPDEGALLTDLYQLTMLQAYFDQGMADTAVFEFFVRKLPAGRNFLVAAGLEQALDYLEGLRFAPEELRGSPTAGAFTSRSSIPSPTCASPARSRPWPRARSSFPTSPSCGSWRPCARPSWWRPV